LFATLYAADGAGWHTTVGQRAPGHD
jgi:hypothetical protein